MAGVTPRNFSQPAKTAFVKSLQARLPAGRHRACVSREAEDAYPLRAAGPAALIAGSLITIKRLGEEEKALSLNVQVC